MSLTTQPASARLRLPSADAVMAQAAAENFPVALRVLGSRICEQLMSIYGFARLVDDVGDEAEGDRLALLALVDQEIAGIYAGEVPEHPLLARLATTVADCNLPRGPLERLIQANRQDQLVSRYETFDDLLGYCQLSAAPVGELVLHVFGQATPQRVALSDLVCDGLQVIEHLQDVLEDHARGRIYLPQEDLRRFGCAEAELSRRPAVPALRQVVAFEAARAAALLQAGTSLTRDLRGRGRLAVAGFVAGGRSALRGLEQVGYDVSRPRPRRGRLFFAGALSAVVAGR